MWADFSVQSLRVPGRGSVGEVERLMPVDSAAQEMLRAVARSSPADSAQQIEHLAASIQDWDSLFRVARQHRVLPMLYLLVTKARVTLPSPAHERLRASYERNVFHSMANAAELIEVLKVFEREAIPAMPFKGVVLAASIYDDITARAAGDLDVLIDYSHLAPATEILLRRGYILETPTRADYSPAIPDCYEYRFQRQSSGTVLELRWRLELTRPSLRSNLGMHWAWPRRTMQIVLGARVPNMDPEKTLLMLCIHGSKHVWSRLLWIMDVAQLLAAFPDLDWQRIDEDAKALGLWRALALGVLLAHRVCGAAAPHTILNQFESDGTASDLARHINANLFDAPGSTPKSHIPYNVKLLAFKDRARFFLSWELFRPNERDQAAARLPKPLHPLYFLVRPIRILLDRSPR